MREDPRLLEENLERLSAAMHLLRQVRDDTEGSYLAKLIPKEELKEVVRKVTDWRGTLGAWVVGIPEVQ